MALKGVVGGGKNSFNTNLPLQARSNLIKDVRDVVGRIHLTRTAGGVSTAVGEKGLGSGEWKSEWLSSRSREEEDARRRRREGGRGKKAL